MDCLQLKYHLSSDLNVERTLYVSVYKLVEEEELTDRVLEVSNIPFFVDESDLKTLFKNEVSIKFANSKSTEKLKSKVALIEFGSKKELKNELRLIKYANEDEKMFLYKSKDDLKATTTKNCGKSLLSKRFVKYIENIDETREQVMEIMSNYNDEILVAQKKKKRRFEREDDGWVKVVRK